MLNCKKVCLFAVEKEDLHDAAQFYWGKPSAWLNSIRLFDRHSFPIKIPRWRVQDIDTEDDWKRAELLYKHIKENYYG